MAESNPWFDGMGFTDPKKTIIHPGVTSGRVPHALGQEGKAATPSALVANEFLGSVSLPAVNQGVVGTVTVTNTLYTVNGLLFLTVVNGNNDATANLAVLAWVQNKAVGGGQFSIGYTPLGANMASAWWCNYQFWGST